MSLTRSLYGLTPPPGYLQLVENLVFKQKVIELDGYRFKNCAFVDCALRTVSGNFKIEECFFQGDSTTYFDGNALHVVRLASLLNWEASGGLKAVIHANGGVSIA